MKNMQIAGTGNSRFMKSAIPETATWEEFLEMLRAGTFAFDLNGINEAGITERGTPYDVNSVLKDSTAELLGGDSSMVPDEAFVALKALGDIGASAAQIKAGSYVGTGAATFNLTLGGKPKFLVICPNKFKFPEHQVNNDLTIALYAGQTTHQLVSSNSRYVNDHFVDFTPTATGMTVKGHGINHNNNNAVINSTLMNTSGTTYYYFALI